MVLTIAIYLMESEWQCQRKKERKTRNINEYIFIDSNNNRECDCKSSIYILSFTNAYQSNLSWSWHRLHVPVFSLWTSCLANTYFWTSFSWIYDYSWNSLINCWINVKLFSFDRRVVVEFMLNNRSSISSDYRWCISLTKACAFICVWI
jgi:hypothetical protein